MQNLGQIKPANKHLLGLCWIGAALLISACASAGQSPAKPDGLDDGAIVAIYNQVNSFDIETGRLGMKKGRSKEVRQLGAMVVKDHTAVRQMATKLAEQEGLKTSLPAARKQAADEHKKTLTELKSQSGADFDRAYLLHEIKFHTAAIQAVNDVLLPAIENPKLKKLVIDVLPGFEHHLAETKRVAKQLGYY